MSNIYHSILEKLAALNIDIYHYEDIVRCYILAKLNIEHSRRPDYVDGIHTAEFDAEVSRYQLLPSNGEPYYDSAAFLHFAVSLSRQVWIKIAGCFLRPSLPSWLLTGIGLCLYSLKDITKDWPMFFI